LIVGKRIVRMDRVLYCGSDYASYHVDIFILHAVAVPFALLFAFFIRGDGGGRSQWPRIE
jgi:hypothetical protein